jgi:hypothetical protein
MKRRCAVKTKGKRSSQMRINIRPKKRKDGRKDLLDWLSLKRWSKKGKTE